MTDFGRTTLPFCSFVLDGERHVGVGIGTQVLDAKAALPDHAALFADGSLDAFLASGPDTWQAVRDALLAHEPTEHLYDAQYLHEVGELVLPFTVADYVDFYASEHHATNVGTMFRPDGDALTPNWKHLPIGYHGRAGTVVTSGTTILRPNGQRRSPDGEITFGPSIKLDIEAELGFVVGVPSALGTPVPISEFDKHVFGVCLVNDWSARDIQAWEYVPLGPFLGKSFATSISPWIIPLAALTRARVDPPAQTPTPLPYLQTDEPWGLNLEFVITLNGIEISRPPFASMYWTGAQMLAHMTVNGASLRTGDLFASGTISGPETNQRGSLLELSWNGTEPISLADGTTRSFLENGDTVAISAVAHLDNGERLELGEVLGTIVSQP
ncbi:fumarylacetoacetase [Aeromicrobium panaciterrae]|uniref:fumarylacetoacetase n=1 Tax=Aeromicrobium panaciterrae TaxID=363861 RepID=A0ABU1UKT7_9ACTN|nr:fumarylacetoacetase [Aeromicrobium panaciterrae]MDR7085781.1 fumarylacetoacetase [Aeromicrobium panaciterrae]